MAQSSHRASLTDYYPLDGEPFTLERTASAVGIGLSTLQKRRQLLDIKPLKSLTREKFISAENVALLQYVERHPYLLTPQLVEQPDALEQLRSSVLEELRKARQG